MKQPAQFGQRAFSYTAPAVWNSLPPTLQQISNTVSFKRHLKTFLYQQAYLDYAILSNLC